MKKLFVIILFICIMGQVYSQSTNLSSYTIWTDNTTYVPNNQNFLDLHISCNGAFSSGTIIAEVFIEQGSDKLIRYREIHPGEETNFYIDLYYHKAGNIYPKVIFTNSSDCSSLEITSSIDSRSTHFPSGRYAEIESIAKKAEVKDGLFGINDEITFGAASLQNAEQVSLNAKKAGAKFIRFGTLPSLNPKTCFSRDLYNCVYQESLNIVDAFYESLTDRKIPATPYLQTYLFQQTLFADMGATEKENFFNLFEFRDNYYYADNFTNCKQLTDDPNNFLNWRGDAPDWLIFGLNSDLMDRYKNDFKIIEVLNEPNLMPNHILSCNPSCLPSNDCWMNNESERTFWKNRAIEFLDYFGDKFKQDGKITILGAVAGIEETNLWGLGVNNWLSSISTVNSKYNYASMHAYSDNTTETKAKYSTYTQSIIEDIKNNFSGKIYVNEFGYGSIPAQSSFPDIFSEIKSITDNDDRIVANAYYILTQRDFMQYFPVWDAYGAAALIRTNKSENWTFSQFYSGEICNSFDDDYDGEIDEGCDDDQDTYPDIQMMCPTNNRFYTWMYNANWKIPRNWVANGVWLYEDGGHNWYQKETSSNIGTGWRWSSLTCNTHGSDIDDANPNVYPGTQPICTDNNWTYNDESCQPTNTKTRTWTQTANCVSGIQHPTTEEISCAYQAPTCTNFTYSDWTPTTCPQSTTQTRTIQTTTPTTCQNGNPESLTRTCTYIPTCTDDHWTSTDGTCQNTNTLIRTWYKTNNCQNGIQKPTTESVSCDYQAPTCTNFTYTNWTPTTCPQTGTQTKTILTKTPTTCHGGNPDALIRSCTHTPICTDDHWDFDLEPATCPSIGEQTKKYFKVTNCQNGITKTDEIILCNYNAPQCQYTYSNYGTCANGIETRTATLTTVETCQGQPIDLTKTCETIPTCTDSHWSFEMTPCTNGTQTKQWTKINDCNNGIIYANEIITCDAEQEQPEYCNQDDWESRIEPAVCPETGTQTKHWTRTNTDCQGGVTHKAQETISCTPKETNNIPDIIRCQTNDDCTGNQECILNECAQVYYPDGLPQNLPNQPDPTPPPTNNQTIYDFTTTEIIEKINNSQDDEAITLLQQAQQSISNGEEEKATAQITIALLKTKTIEEPELITQYEQAILALNQDNYETANQLALDAMDPPVKQQDFETILTIIAVLIIIIVVLIIFGRRK